MSMTTGLAQLKPGNYAILYRDNWDGEGDVYHCLAVLDEEGEWRDFETTAQLLQYKGDGILKAWPLDDGSDVLALVEALEARDKQIAELRAKDINVKRQAQALFDAIQNPDDAYIPAYVRCLRNALTGVAVEGE